MAAWDFFRRLFALRTGEIAYSMIRSVEKRREAIKWGQTCIAVCLIVRDQPLRTFVRGGVGDHQWLEAFARDIASRACHARGPRDGLIDVDALALKGATTLASPAAIWRLE